MDALKLIDGWAATTSAAAVVQPSGAVSFHGQADHVFRLASVSKLITAWATLIAIEEGSIELDGPAGPEGSTVRHLLAHAAGYSFDGPGPIVSPARNRIYSNTGYEVLAAHVAQQTGIAFDIYVKEAIGQPLDMATLSPLGSPAKSFRCSARDLARFAHELLVPTLLAPQTVALATSPQFPQLSGVLPGIGRFSPNLWGLGPEIRGNKQPHWTGTLNSTQTFGHFGGSGTFVWIDPVEQVACLALTDLPFDRWAMTCWPALSDAVITEHRNTTP